MLSLLDNWPDYPGPVPSLLTSAAASGPDCEAVSSLASDEVHLYAASRDQDQTKHLKFRSNAPSKLVLPLFVLVYFTFWSPSLHSVGCYFLANCFLGMSWIFYLFPFAVCHFAWFLSHQKFPCWRSSVWLVLWPGVGTGGYGNTGWRTFCPLLSKEEEGKSTAYHQLVLCNPSCTHFALIIHISLLVNLLKKN